MAEQVNQRIEDMISELEQMRRTNLYNEDEIREIARKRKEFEYRIQRRVKSKEDFVHYIAYELTLLEDIAQRRKLSNLTEKKKEIEYAIAKRLNKIFKQFIYRFQNDIEIYFQYIKFCMSVGFDQAVSGIIGQMLQVYGDKPMMWLMASKWESAELNQPLNARNFLLKGIHRHPDSTDLYLELFKIELMLVFQAESDEEKEKQIKRADVVWKNATKQIIDVQMLFKMFDLAQKFEIDSITNEIKERIWSKRNEKGVWSFIASKELEGCHWEGVEEFVDTSKPYPKLLKYFTAIYEEALTQFPDQQLCRKYIHGLLDISANICTDDLKVNIVKDAWMFGHKHGLLSNDMYDFGLQVLKLENEMSKEEILQILDEATKTNPLAKSLWQEKLILSKPDEKRMLGVMQEASKSLKGDDLLVLWNLLLDNVETSSTLKAIYKRLQNCENFILMSIKPNLLQKMYQHTGLKSARDMYEEFIRTPPIQLEVHTTMIGIENSQDAPNIKQIRKCYECLIQHCGDNNTNVWMDYISFETNSGNAHFAPAIYRRALAALKKELADEFIKAQALSKIK